MRRRLAAGIVIALGVLAAVVGVSTSYGAKAGPSTRAPTACVMPPFAAIERSTLPLCAQTSRNGLPSRVSTSIAGIGVSCS